MSEGAEKGIVFNIMRYSTEDGPGLRTTVFLKGCPLSCQWCHNPESQNRRPELIFRPKNCIGCGKCLEVCPQGAISPGPDGLVQDMERCIHCGACAEVCPSGAREMAGREMSAAQVMAEIMKDLAFYEESGGGVTFGGGEPLYQPEFLLALLKASKEEELHTAVDTSGLAAPETIRRVAALTDLFLYDLKHMDEIRHLALVGTPNQLILDNLRLLNGLGRRVVVRVPFIPGVNDGEENLDRMGRLLSSLDNINEVELLPYHDTGLEKYRLLGRAGEIREQPRPDPRNLERAGGILSAMGLNVKIKGLSHE